MSVQVTVTLGNDGLVAVKRASTDREVERLRAEAFRLRRAGHPGVVALVHHRRVPGGEELHLRYAGDPAERWRGTLAQAAGLSAAVAATLADLHDLGLVHGRLDPSHVLVGGDGRPRLCGLSDPGEADPADDVLAVGRLVESLLERVSEPRKGPFAWPGGQAGDRKALARVVARAVDPEPARRPSARALATSILAAVHDAELPPRTGETPAVLAAPTVQAATATDAPPSPLPTVEQGAARGADIRHGSDAPDAPVPGVRSGARRPTDAAEAGEPVDWARFVDACAAADGPGPLQALGATSADEEDEEEGTEEDVWRIGTPSPWPGHTGADEPAGSFAGGLRRARPSAGSADGARAVAREHPGAEPEAPADEPWVSVWSLDPASSLDADVLAAPVQSERGPDRDDDRPRGIAGAAVQGEGWEGSALDAWLTWSVSAGLERPLPRPGPPSEAAPPAPTTAPPELARARAEVRGPVPLPRLGDGPRLEEGTRDWSRGRLAEADDPPVPAPDRRNRRVLVGVAAAGALGVGIVAGALALTGAPSAGPAMDARAAGACARVGPPAADVDGDGCSERLTVDGNRVSAGGATWEVGEPGDVVAVGDWDCDGAATSALLRPATGDVFVFAGWSGDGEPVTVTPTRSVPGGVGLRVDEGGKGCDELVVESAGGSGTVVEEARA